MCTSTLTLCSVYFTYAHRKHKIKLPIGRILSATPTKPHSTHFKVESFKNSPLCFLMLPVWAFQVYRGNARWHREVKWDRPHKAAACTCLPAHTHTRSAGTGDTRDAAQGSTRSPQRRRLKHLPLRWPLVGPQPHCTGFATRPLLRPRVQLTQNRNLGITGYDNSHPASLKPPDPHLAKHRYEYFKWMTIHSFPGMCAAYT